MDIRMFGVAFVAVAALVIFSASAPFVSADPVPNESASSVTVTGIVDVTVNCTTIGFGSLAPGVANSSSTGANACFPLEITIHADTNTQTQIWVNGSNMLNGGTVFGVRNITYTNGTAAPAPNAFKTELNASFTSGNPAAATYHSDWVAIADPAADINRYAYFYLSTPATIPKGSYSGTIYMQITDTG
ncbi:Uncharacterised protein [Candidatus Norongarragalina meridionalis]|nr:Uncharacterised protein [Candidatus Norongarragalina meridionalis]